MGLLKYSIIIGIVSYIAYCYLYTDGRPENLQDYLRGKNIVITGGSGGIGKQFALYYAKQGANVVVIARREKNLKEVVEECKKLSPQTHSKAVINYVVADMEEVQQSAQVMKKAIALLGGTLDHLVLNHAYMPSNSEVACKWDGSEEQLKGMSRSVNINFLSFVHLASAALPALKKSNGNILAISSFAAELPAFILPYGATKGAINSFFSGLRQEFLQDNINVSVTLAHLGAVTVETSNVYLTEMSKPQGRDLEELYKIFPKTEGDQAAADLIWATVSRQGDIYYPSNQRLWWLKFVRLVVPNADKNTIMLEEAFGAVLNAKKYLGF